MNIKTKYGTLIDYAREEYHTNGTLASCTLQSKTTVKTAVGELVPQYNYDDLRRKYIHSLTFYDSGDLKSVSLETVTEIETPLGKFPAEFITFYPSGAIKRFFPLNGKLSGYWSETQEAELAVPFNFEFSFANFKAKIIGLHFYETGQLHSLTLQPEEVITLKTPIGDIPVKTGFSLDAKGKLASLEPAKPTPVKTPIGIILAFDSQSVGIHADSNSLIFSETGDIVSIKTTDQIMITTKDTVDFIKPMEKMNPLNDDSTIIFPLTLKFTDTEFIITDTTDHHYSLSTSKVTIAPSTCTDKPSCTSSDCSSCGLCK
jgi:hypothetical protein